MSLGIAGFLSKVQALAEAEDSDPAWKNVTVLYWAQYISAIEALCHR
jgi:hypothetical protein